MLGLYGRLFAISLEPRALTRPTHPGGFRGECWVDGERAMLTPTGILTGPVSNVTGSFAAVCR